MKKFFFLALFFPLALGAARANDIYAKVLGGVTVPTTSIASDPQLGWGCLIGVGYRFGSFFEPMSTLEYNRFDVKNPPGTEISNADILSWSANAQFDFGAKLPVNPYVFVGGGFDSLIGLGTEGMGSVFLEWNPAVQVGAGVEFLPSQDFGFYAEARYHLMFRPNGAQFSFARFSSGSEP